MRGRQWVFLAPCSNRAAQKHLVDTVLKGVRFADIEEYLEEREKIVLRDKDPLKVWGNVPGKRKGWEDIETGDFILFYQQGKFTHAGKIYCKIDNVKLSEKLWTDYKEGKPWRYMYFMEEINEVEIPLTLIRDYSGYGTGFVPMGFTMLRSKAMDAIIQNHGSVEAFVQKHKKDEEKSYFILITGSEKYKDEPSIRYHFKKGIPGSEQLKNAENKGKFVYYQNGEFYAKGEIGKITSYEENEFTYYYAEVKNFERILPVNFEEIRNNLSFGYVGQAGIRRISEIDYNKIIAAKSRPTFVFTKKDFESCTGKREDAKYLQGRFKEFLEAIKPLLPSFLLEKLWVPRINVQGKKEYRWSMWVGTSHPDYKDPRSEMQFQFYMRKEYFFAGIWGEGPARRAREEAAERIRVNRIEFIELIRELPPNFSIKISNEAEKTYRPAEFGEEQSEEFVEHVSKQGMYLTIGPVLTPDETIDKKGQILEFCAHTIRTLIPIYSLVIGKSIQVEEAESRLPSPSLDKIIKYIESKGFFYPEETIKNYHASLETKPFVILSGITGIGKTKLTELYANAFHDVEKENEYYKIIPVQPNWNDKKPLLGYFNPILETYFKTPFLDFLLKALEDCQSCDLNVDENCKDKSKCTRKYFVCLDEMNLAHVEYYFADFLSAMESDRLIDLHSTQVKTEDGKMLGPKIKIPENLYIVGTVNIDETTKEFSPKVLDRANTIYLDVVDLDRWLEIQRKLGKPILGSAFQVVKDINELLRKHQMHFGYRVCDEILKYVNTYTLPIDRSLDLQIMQKILPKFSGDDNERLRGSLQDLKDYLERTQYSSSFAKVESMLDKLDKQGFTSFFD